MLNRALSPCIVVTDADECFAVSVEPPTPGFPTRRFDEVQDAFAFANGLCDRRGWTIFDMTKIEAKPEPDTPAKGHLSAEVRAKIGAAVKAQYARRKAAEAEGNTA